MNKVGLIPVLFSLTLLANCTGELPISDLINNTITLKVLGTYESNDPYGFLTLPKDDVITATEITNANPALTGTPAIVSYANGLTASDVKYYIDIAEIRLARGQGKSSSQSISDYWSQFAIDRQLMCSDYSSSDPNRTLSNCAEQNGIQRLYDFFNGGFTYPAVDVQSGTFNHLGVYFRRFATFPAARFNGNGTYYDGSKDAAQQKVTTTFDNRTIYGLDIESLLQNQYGESATEPKMFPLQRKDLNLVVQYDHEPYVLEVRIFLKNLMMVHVLQATGNATFPTDASNSAFVYVAPADWNIDHAYTDLTNGGKQGGSVLLTARIYQPAKVGSLQMDATFNTTTNASYFVAVPSGTTFDPKTALPLMATRSTVNTISSVQPGTYDVYRTCDVTKCTNSSTAGTCDNTANAPDGFPETAVLCEANKVVSTGTPTTVATATCGAVPAFANCL